MKLAARNTSTPPVIATSARLNVGQCQPKAWKSREWANKAVTATVDDIADGAASNQCKAKTLDPDPRSQSEPHDEKGHQQRESDQQHPRKVALCGKEAKADARVVAEAQVEEGCHLNGAPGWRKPSDHR